MQPRAVVATGALQRQLRLGEAQRRWLAVLAVFFASFLLFAPSFDAWFAVLDFNHLDAIRSTGAGTYFKRIFDPGDGGRTLFGTGELYRPTYYAVYWLEYQAFGLDALPYYVFNTTLHAINSVLVWLLAWRLTRSTLASTAAALVWAYHPQYADTVAWISSVTDLLLVFFALSAVLLYARALEERARRRWLSYGGSLAAALLALGAKESGIAVVPIIAGYHISLGQPDLLRRRQVPWRLLPFLLIPAVYFPLRAVLVGNLATEGNTTFPSSEFIANIHKLSGLAAGPLVGQSVSNSAYGAGQGAAGVLVTAITVVGALLGGRRGWFLAGWYYVALLPYLLLIPLLLVGRYLYLPFVGVAILIGIGIARGVGLLKATDPVRQLVATALVLGVLVWFGILNGQYQNWLTAKGDDARAFIDDLKATYPTLPDTGRLIVTEYPPTLSLTPDDGYMLRPAIRLAYDRYVEVLTLSQLESGSVPPPAEDDLWYPPGTQSQP